MILAMYTYHIYLCMLYISVTHPVCMYILSCKSYIQVTPYAARYFPVTFSAAQPYVSNIYNTCNLIWINTYRMYVHTYIHMHETYDEHMHDLRMYVRMYAVTLHQQCC